MTEKKQYQADISDDAVAEALRAVEKPAGADTPAAGAAGVEIQVEAPTPGPAGGEAEAGPSRQDLIETVEKLRQEAKAARERMLRIAADADNTRKRALREREEGIRFANEELLKDFLPVADNLDRSLSAMAAADLPEAAAAVRKGVEMVRDQFQAVLRKHQVEKFSAQGQPFDPGLHEAISREECADAAPGTVVREIHCGYRYRDRLLRPALVTVACAPAGAKADEGTSSAAGSAEPDNP